LSQPRYEAPSFWIFSPLNLQRPSTLICAHKQVLEHRSAKHRGSEHHTAPSSLSSFFIIPIFSSSLHFTFHFCFCFPFLSLMYPRHKVPLSLQTSFGLCKHALSFPFDLCTRRTFILAPYSISDLYTECKPASRHNPQSPSYLIFY